MIWRVVRLATLTMASDQLQAELALGGRIDFNDLLAIDKQLAELRKELKPAAKPLAVQVTYVHPTTKCPQCGNAFSLDLPDDDSSGSPVQAASNKPLPGDPYVVAKPADPTPPKAPGSIVAAVPGSAAMSRPAVIDLEQRRDDRAAELRQIARTTGGITPPPSIPRPNYNFPDNESPAAFSRRISDAYR